MKISLDVFQTFLAATAVLLSGRWLIARISVLRTYNIPEPVAGGLIVAILVTLLRTFGVEVAFDTALQTPLMLMFFCTIGLSANIRMILAGGEKLVRFLLIVTAFLIMQNTLGVGIALLLNVDPLLGLLGGSITMAGGHGTGTAWAATFSAAPYHMSGALEVAMACATFGLVLGGLIGGPVARFLINRMPESERPPLASSGVPATPVTTSPVDPDGESIFEKPEVYRPLTSHLLIEKLFFLGVAMTIGFALERWTAGTAAALPTFVWMLFCGVLVGNLVAYTPFYDMEERALSVVGNTCLSLFLAMALMSLKLWELVSLALPIVSLLAVQTVAMVLWAVFITYRFMGRNYDAAVLAAGHCGFGMGATPTAIANMQAVTARFGPSHLAFILVPIVGAFFIDLVNSLVLKAFLALPIFPGA